MHFWSLFSIFSLFSRKKRKTPRDQKCTRKWTPKKCAGKWALPKSAPESAPESPAVLYWLHIFFAFFVALCFASAFWFTLFLGVLFDFLRGSFLFFSRLAFSRIKQLLVDTMLALASNILFIVFFESHLFKLEAQQALFMQAQMRQGSQTRQQEPPGKR